MADKSYGAVMARRPEIMRKAVGIDYNSFESGSLGFDYESMMSKAAFGIDKIREIQRATGIGNTPLLKMKNLTPTDLFHPSPAPHFKTFQVFLI